MTETEILRHIRDAYGPFIYASAERHGHHPEVVAGIMCRETQGGLSTLLDKPGPEGRGDRDDKGVYHGHGLMQIDDRSFPEFVRSGNWRDPGKNIEFGCLVLAKKRHWLRIVIEREALRGIDLERAAIAAYNGGEGNVRRAIREGRDIDWYTAHRNYSRDVLRFAETYRGMDAKA